MISRTELAALIYVELTRSSIPGGDHIDEAFARADAFLARVNPPADPGFTCEAIGCEGIAGDGWSYGHRACPLHFGRVDVVWR